MVVKGSVRSSQLVTTYGVGAMVAAKDESFIIAGIEDWVWSEEFKIHEPRLERMLGVHSFVRPPSTGESNSYDVPVRRFPRMYSCPRCERLADISVFRAPFGDASCTFCDDTPALVPSRFVIACANGHLDDFPYYHWVHKNHKHTGESAKLKLRAKGESAGLRDIFISCSCGAKESLDGAFAKWALRGVRRCPGSRPWLARDNEEQCDQVPVTIQRGASNVWFSSTISAISIPPWSDSAFKLLNRHWAILRKQPSDLLGRVIEAAGIADDDHPLEELVQAAIYRQAQEAGKVDDEDVKEQEYLALMRGAPEKPGNQFVCVPARNPGPTALGWIPTVKQVTRLREVRVLRGFSRLMPPLGSQDDDGGGHGNIVRLPGPEQGWLPAIEVIGEGVFLELSSDKLTTWERRTDVRERTGRLSRRWDAAAGWDPRIEVTPRFVMLHTLAHSLIDQWALESGYNAAALTERLYVTDERAGILIYTATSDSAGSLGGVVAMTDNDRLNSSLLEAIKRASWCSADPLCIETSTQGADALNLAACHACALLPEVSCENRNQLLDRALLIGTPEHPELGFFADLVR